MGFTSALQRFFGIIPGDETEGDDGDRYEAEEHRSRQYVAPLAKGNGGQGQNSATNTGKVIPFSTHGGVGSLVICEPDGFDDAHEVTDHLRERRTVCLNLEDTDPALARRIVDFLSGSVYALDADFQKASRGVFIIAPSNVEIQSLRGDLKISRKGHFPYANGG
jgi:cell division inhibitor SepF